MKHNSQDLYALVLEQLKSLKDIGYHPSSSGGAAIGSSLGMTCDCCGRPTNMKVSYEKDYPNNPDVGLCLACCDNLRELYKQK